jgi:osmotically-inducible protein OsmY
MTDNDLKQHVLSALDWEPSLDATDIGVSVDDAVVTLRGNVASYAEQVTAERVALRVYGVKAVANDLAVRLVSEFERTDTEIAHAAVAALEWNTVVPNDRVTVTVNNGWIALKGTLDWQFQKDAAARVVRSHERKGCDQRHHRSAARQDDRRA